MTRFDVSFDVGESVVIDGELKVLIVGIQIVGVSHQVFYNVEWFANGQLYVATFGGWRVGRA